MNKYKGILAIDFDDTIAKTSYPEIEEEVKDSKKYINKLFEDGWYIIIWTCRCNDNNEKEPLRMADEWLVKNGYWFHRINDHHPYLMQKYKNDSRKIAADFYIDDKNIFGLRPWKEMYEYLSNLPLDRNHSLKEIEEEVLYE